MITLLQALPVRASVFLFCACSCLALGEEKMLPGAAGDRHLVEVTFALDDKLSTEDFHTVLTFWISEKNRGMTRWVYNWAAQGGHGPETNAVEKAAKCLKLIKALHQPKDLPESRNQIVTARCREGGETLVRRFPIERVPSQVHEVLTLMGAREAEFTRLRFAKGAADGPANRSQPVQPEADQTSGAAGFHR
jgi:hypothetical protein